MVLTGGMRMDAATILEIIIQSMRSITSLLVIYTAVVIIKRGRWFHALLTKLDEYIDIQSKKINTISEDRNIVTTSNELLAYIQSIASQIAGLKVREFYDSHRIDRVTRANIASLAAEVAREVNKSININCIKFENILITKEFYESYIVNISFALVKALFDDVVDSNVGLEGLEIHREEVNI